MWSNVIVKEEGSSDCTDDSSTDSSADTSRGRQSSSSYTPPSLHSQRTGGAEPGNIATTSRRRGGERKVGYTSILSRPMLVIYSFSF